MCWPRYWAAVCLSLVACPTFAQPAEPPAASQRPNVLLIVSDDLNCDLGCYGHRLVQSPHIDELADRGVRFELAYCQYPVCNPSRSSFLTSLYPDQTGVLNNARRFRDKVPDVVTLPQWFGEQGYSTARVGKLFHYGVPRHIGTDGLDDPPSWQQVVNPRGIDREVHDRIHTLVPGQFGGTLSWLNMDQPASEHTDGIGATEAIKLLETLHPDETGQPFFLGVGFYRPHTPFVAPGKFFELYPRDRIEPVLEVEGDRDDIPVAALADRRHQRELSLERRREIIQAYYASISLMDAQVGRLLDALKRLELADNTVVVMLSDHGYHLGAHGLWQKGDLFEGSVRTPLVISVPQPLAEPQNITNGESTSAITELVDLYPTLCELCDLATPEHVMGTSLVPVLRDTSRPGKPAALTVGISRAGGMHKEIRGKRVMGYTIRTPRYRYTEWNEGRQGDELYDYQADPNEITNLTADPEHKSLKEDMQRMLSEAKARAR